MLRLVYGKLSSLWYRLVTLKSSPRKIALGFALGIFLSYTPTFGFQTALAIGMATMLRVNPISATVGVYWTNVFTVWPIYVLCYKVGSWVAGVHADVNSQTPAIDAGWGLFAHITKLGLNWIALESLGGLIVGVVSAIPAYFLALFAVVRYRTARLNRRIRRMRKQIAPPADGDT